MSAIIKGSGVFWSIGGITFTAGIVSATNTEYVQSARLARTSEKTEVKDDGGTIKAVAFHGLKKTASITVVPYGSTLANGKTSVEAHIPSAGTAITVADGAGTIFDQTFNLITATQNRSVDGVVTVDLELEGSDEGVDITTVIS